MLSRVVWEPKPTISCLNGISFHILGQQRDSTVYVFMEMAFIKHIVCTFITSCQREKEKSNCKYIAPQKTWIARLCL